MTDIRFLLQMADQILRHAEKMVEPHSESYNHIGDALTAVSGAENTIEEARVRQ